MAEKVPDDKWYIENTPKIDSIDAMFCLGFSCTQETLDELWKLLRPIAKIGSLTLNQGTGPFSKITPAWAVAALAQPLPETLQKLVSNKQRDWISQAIMMMITKLVGDEWELEKEKHPGKKREFPTRLLAGHVGLQPLPGGRLVSHIATWMVRGGFELKFQGDFVFTHFRVPIDGNKFCIRPWLVTKAVYFIDARDEDFILKIEQGGLIWIAFTLENMLLEFIERYRKGYPEQEFEQV